MRKIRLVLLIAVCGAMVGCKSVNRLIEGSEAPEQKPVRVISDNGTLSETPQFLVPVIPGKDQLTFHNIVPANGLIFIRPEAESTVQVFVKDFSGFWFVISSQASEGYSYQFDAVNGEIQLNSSNMDFLKEYLIYQYVEQQ